MAPQDVTRCILQGVNGVAVGLVAHGEHPSVRHRDRGKAGADRGIPKSLGAARAPFLEPVRFLGDAIVVRAAPVGPIGRLANQDGRDEQCCCDEYFFHDRFDLAREI